MKQSKLGHFVKNKLTRAEVFSIGEDQKCVVFFQMLFYSICD